MFLVVITSPSPDMLVLTAFDCFRDKRCFDEVQVANGDSEYS